MAQKQIRNKLFFTSDLHFGHKNILKYCEGRIKIVGNDNDIKKHDRIVIERWNSVVSENDTVVIVGDVKMCGNVYARECIAKLNGRKILVRGNHDLGRSKMMRMGFDWACDELHVNLGGTRVLVSHYPYRLSKIKYYWMKFKQLFYKREIYDFRKMHRRPHDHGMILLHGHTHQDFMIDGRMIHVGLDSNNMYPMSDDMLAKLIGEIKKKENVRG